MLLLSSVKETLIHHQKFEADTFFFCMPFLYFYFHALIKCMCFSALPRVQEIKRFFNLYQCVYSDVRLLGRISVSVGPIT